MRWPLRNQLLVPLLTLLLGVAGITAWAAFASAARARRQIETQVRHVTRTLNEVTFSLNRATLAHMKNLSGADYVVLFTDGSRESTLPAGAAVELPPAEAVADNWETLGLGPRVTVKTDGVSHAYLGSGVRLRQPRADRAETLYILYPESLWRDALWEAMRPPLLLGGFAGLASVALAAGVGRRLSRRVQELERRTRLIAAGDFSPMPLPRRNDELRDLARSVNDMAQQLAQLQETMRRTERLRLLGQVSGGLAHQLRNGVTGAKLAVQLHAEDCQADDEALGVALRQLALVEANLKRFLELGRGENLRREPCSLSALVGEAVELLRPQCRHVGIDLQWKPPEGDCTLTGDAGQLGHLFLNVIGNAVEAAGPGGAVEVRLQTERGRSAIIEVWDTGPGPSPEVAERLFEPFVTGKREGVGLGLAVARQAAEAHGGRITWRREAGRTCFVIELPLGEMSERRA